ncbi:MAG: pyruvate kinase [Candidatus Uhrbacteria bacterium]
MRMTPPANRTKIVCTIGPASESRAALERLMRAGMDVARLNFSHGEYAWHAKAIRTIRAVAKAAGEPVAILQDLQGPKVRVGKLPEEGVMFKAGKPITLTTATTNYDGQRIPLTYQQLHRDVKPKHRILFDDGLLEMRVVRVRGRDIACRVITGGILKSHKGMNLPDTTLDISALTAKDHKDVKFGATIGVDFVALSFVQRAADIVQLRRLLARLGSQAAIIAKIEKPAAIVDFDGILSAANGIMIARGDLGVEIPAAEVPLRQKEIIEKCRLAGKPVIVATQMLDSMIRNPRPTRAEVSDAANAIIDHADAVMLSGETATGKYPVEAVKMMAKIATETEASRYDDVDPYAPPITAVRNQSCAAWELGNVVGEVAAILTAHTGNVAGVLVATLTGRAARCIAQFRPQLPVFAATPDSVIFRQLNMSYGIRPLLIPPTPSRDAFLRAALQTLRARRLVRRGTQLIVIAGEPWGQSGTANAVDTMKC